MGGHACDLGFVGAGSIARALGRFASASGMTVCFYDVVTERASEAASMTGGTAIFSLERLVYLSDALSVSVPGSIAPDVLRSIFSMDYVRGKLVFETSTFKEDVSSVISRAPEGVKVAMVHPLFGGRARRPDAHYVAVIPVEGREEGAGEASVLFSRMGLNVVIIGLEDHEELAALSMGLTYLLSEAVLTLLEERGLNTSSPLPGTTYRYLRKLLDAISEDSEELRREIVGNPRVRSIARRLSEIIAAMAEGNWSPSRIRPSSDGYSAIYKCLEECVEDFGQR